MRKQILMGMLVIGSSMVMVPSAFAATTTSLHFAVNYYVNNGVIADPTALIMSGTNCGYDAKKLPLTLALSSDWQYDDADYMYHQNLSVNGALTEFDGCQFALQDNNGTYICTPNPFKTSADSKLMNILKITVTNPQQCNITQSWIDPPPPVKGPPPDIIIN